MKDAYSYYRIASGGIPDLEAQKSKLNEWAMANGYTIINEYIDGNISGLAEPRERKAFNRMLEDLKAVPVDSIIVLDFSRLSRNIHVFQDIVSYLRARGVSIYSVSANSEAFGVLGETLQKAAGQLSAQMPGQILKILLGGNMDQSQYQQVENYYIKSGDVRDWFGPAGVDSRGEYYHYIVNYRTAEAKVYKVYLS